MKMDAGNMSSVQSETTTARYYWSTMTIPVCPPPHYVAVKLFYDTYQIHIKTETDMQLK